MKMFNNQAYSAELTGARLTSPQSSKNTITSLRKIINCAYNSNSCVSIKHLYHRTATQINYKNYTVYATTEQVETITQEVQYNVFTCKLDKIMSILSLWSSCLVYLSRNA